MGSESDVNEINQVVEPVGDDDCVVCLELLANEADARTLVTLRCSHQFHLGEFLFLFVKEHQIYIFKWNFVMRKIDPYLLI